MLIREMVQTDRGAQKHLHNAAFELLYAVYKIISFLSLFFHWPTWDLCATHHALV